MPRHHWGREYKLTHRRSFVGGNALTKFFSLVFTGDTEVFKKIFHIVGYLFENYIYIRIIVHSETHTIKIKSR